jgi:hypothetical protein
MHLDLLTFEGFAFHSWNDVIYRPVTVRLKLGAHDNARLDKLRI